MTLDQSHTLFRSAEQCIPGGVNSPVRAFKSVGGTPIFFESAQGSSLYSVDGKKYLDYVSSWGPMILGHAHPTVLAAVQAAVARGLSFGAPNPDEVKLAELVCARLPSIARVRFVNSGTEAVMSAIRLARGFTGKSKILKFVGCYHGHADSMLVAAGSGAMTHGVPSSPGVPDAVAADTLVANYNDLDSVAALFAAHGDDIAAVIVEPVAGNMGVVLPQPEFLPGLRDICTKSGALLIFDEVMTGFRVAPGGVQTLYEITPDLTTLGKVVGGGLPVGAFGGRADIMAMLSPEGPVYQAGTLSGNPIAMAAGVATLQCLAEPGCYDRLAATTATLQAGITQLAQQFNRRVVVNAICGMMSIFFTDQERVDSYDAVMQSSVPDFCALFKSLLTQGIYFAPSAYEALFPSLAHTEQDLQTTLAAIEQFWSKE